MTHRFAILLAWAGCALAQSVAAAPIPFKQEPAVGAAALSGGALGVLLLSALAIVAVLVLRKRLNLPPAKRGGQGLLRVLETQRLGPRTLLSVVEFAGGQYLIAQSEHGVNCLAQAPRGNPAGAPAVVQEGP